MKKELGFVKDQKNYCTKNDGNIYTIDNYILNKPELKKIKKFLDECCKDYLKTVICPQNNVEIYITQSWCNYNSTGDIHGAHTHSNSLISGVLYIQGKDTPTIFYRENEMFPLKFNYESRDMNNCEAYVMDAEVGKLFIFPSNIKHSAAENKTDTERISLAFNTWATGEFGAEKNSNWLKLK